MLFSQLNPSLRLPDTQAKFSGHVSPQVTRNNRDSVLFGSQPSSGQKRIFTSDEEVENFYNQQLAGVQKHRVRPDELEKTMNSTAVNVFQRASKILKGEDENRLGYQAVSRWIKQNPTRVECWHYALLVAEATKAPAITNVQLLQDFPEVKQEGSGIRRYLLERPQLSNSASGIAGLQLLALFDKLREKS